MGGAREDVLQSSAPVASRRGSTTVSGPQKIRIHEENRQVHFHDDDKHLKAAVPVDTWFKAWTDMTTTFGQFAYHDTDNQTLLVVEVNDHSGTLDAVVTIEKMDQNVGDTFRRLQKFTMG